MTAADVADRLRRALSSGAISVGLVDDAAEVVANPGFADLDAAARASFLHTAGAVALESGRTDHDVGTLDRAVRWLDDALAQYGVGTGAWAQAAGNLALALLERHDLADGGTPAEVRRAIVLLKATVGLLDDKAQVAIAQHNLGAAYRADFDMTRDRESLDSAIHRFRNACAGADDAEARAGYRSSLAYALRERYHLRATVGDLHEAVTEWGHACDESEVTSLEWLTYAVGLANGKLDVAEAAGDEAASRRAVELFRGALARRDPATESWRQTANNLGNALWVHYRLSGERAPLVEAQGMFASLLTEIDIGTQLGATIAANAAAALHELYENAGLLTALEKSIALGEQLVGEPSTTLSADAALGRQHNLAISLLARYKRLGQEDDINRAVILLEDGVKHNQHGVAAAAANDSLGNALQLRFDRTGMTDDLVRAVRAHEVAVDLYEGQDLDVAMARSNLGVALCALGLDTSQRTHLDRAIREQRAAVTSIPARSPLRPRVLTALADSLAMRADSAWAHFDETDPDHPSGDATDATVAYRRAARLGLRTLPEQAVGASVSWGDWASSHGKWDDAIEAYSYGIRAVRRLVDAHQLAPHKETWLRSVQGLPQGAAYALAQLAQVRKAVRIVEQGRANLLDEALRSRVVPPTGGRRRRRPIRQIVVYLVTTGPGGVALVVTASTSGRSPEAVSVQLPELTDVAVRERVDTMTSAYRTRANDWSHWADVLDDTCRWLWDVIVGPLDAAGVLAPEVVLIPAGGLASLPIHAAWTPTIQGRRWLLTESAVSYSPNARFLREVDTQLGVRRQGRRAATVDGVRQGLTVAVSNPQPTTLPPLSYVEMELEAVTAGIGETVVLSGPRATFRNVAAALTSAAVVHVACHGLSSPTDPHSSAIYLAGDEPLSVDDLMRTPMTTVNLAVLSACESGMIGDAVPDEMIGLPVALLQAGLRTVVATQWSVQDLATSLIVGEFYRRWRPGATPAAALQTAQIWLASATFADLVARFPAVFEQRAPAGGVARRLWERARPYAHPTAWAAFTVMGDGYS